ncbi:MAG: accessory factor UbiK family protein [Rhodospirillales bacterium]|nr:MAG: accessory factor UbiK family protein [Rhodospirillales bacterium]
MQTSNRLLDDLAKVASGAASAFAGIRQEVDAVVRQRLERLIADFDLVTRDEFEAVRATAANARAEQEALAERLARLEQRLAGSDATTEAPSPGDLPSGETGADGRL